VLLAVDDARDIEAAAGSVDLIADAAVHRSVPKCSS
jgi:hypothetical protein